MAAALPALRFPVFAREAADMFRRGRTYVLQGVYLAGLLATVALFWPRGEGSAGETGRWLFRALIQVQLAAVALVAPALAAPALARERERETLGLLAIAGVSAPRIVFGMAMGRLAHVSVLVLLSAPIVLSLYVVGGLSPGQLAPPYIEAVALGLLGVGLGSFFSARGRRPEVATLWSLLSVLAVAALPELLAKAVRGFPARHISPTAWFRAVFDPHATTGEVDFALWWIAPLVHAGSGLLLLLAASARLAGAGYEPIRTPGRASVTDSPAAGGVPLLRAFLRLRKRGGPLGLTGRFGTEVAALRWRERSARSISDGALALVLLLLLVLFEVLAPANQAIRTELRQGTATLLAAMATLAATLLGAVAVARERDQHTLEPLAAAPIDAEQFLLGKLLGLSRGVAILGAAVVLHVGIGAVRGSVVLGPDWSPSFTGTPDIPWAAVVAIAGTIPFGLALHAVIGLSFSCTWESAIKASAWSLAVAVVIGAVAGASRTCLFYGLSPPAFCSLIFDWQSTGLGDPRAAPWQWIAIAIAAAIHAAAAGVVAWNHLRARFDQLVGRAALDIIALPDTMPDL